MDERNYYSVKNYHSAKNFYSVLEETAVAHTNYPYIVNKCYRIDLDEVDDEDIVIVVKKEELTELHVYDNNNFMRIEKKRDKSEKNERTNIIEKPVIIEENPIDTTIISDITIIPEKRCNTEKPQSKGKEYLERRCWTELPEVHRKGK